MTLRGVVVRILNLKLGNCKKIKIKSQTFPFSAQHFVKIKFYFSIFISEFIKTKRAQFLKINVSQLKIFIIIFKKAFIFVVKSIFLSAFLNRGTIANPQLYLSKIKTLHDIIISLILFIFKIEYGTPTFTFFAALNNF